MYYIHSARNTGLRILFAGVVSRFAFTVHRISMLGRPQKSCQYNIHKPPQLQYISQHSEFCMSPALRCPLLTSSQKSHVHSSLGLHFHQHWKFLCQSLSHGISVAHKIYIFTFLGFLWSWLLRISMLTVTPQYWCSLRNLRSSALRTVWFINKQNFTSSHKVHSPHSPVTDLYVQ